MKLTTTMFRSALLRLYGVICCRHTPSLAAFVVLATAVSLCVHIIVFSNPLTAPNSLEEGDADQQCHLPNLNPWDPSIMRYVFKVEPLVCPRVSDLITVEQSSPSGDLQLIYLTENHRPVACQYRKVVRRNNDDDIAFGPEAVRIETFPFKEWPIDTEFLEVRCFQNSSSTTVIYENIFAKIQPIPPPPQKETGNSPKPWNVLIIGLDSVSKLNFIRTLPKSYKKLQEFGAIFYNGYNKVGENTFPNLVPMLTGERVELEPDDPPNKLPHPAVEGSTFDDYPFVWKEFKEHNYATLFAEDMTEISTFNYHKKGFLKPPTDHYIRPFVLAMDNMRPLDSILNPVLQIFEAKNLQLTGSPSLCFQGRKKHVAFWDYSIRQFASAYSKPETKRPFFGISWIVEPSHDHINLVSVCDDDLLDLLQWIHPKAGNIDERTITFVMADHGARFDNIRNTVIGRIEDRMPVFAALFPDSFKAQYPKLFSNFKKNADRLTSPIDTFWTLRHILHLGVSNRAAKKFGRFQIDPTGRWAASLLAEVLPLTRKCNEAGIPEQYCACYKENAVNQPDKNEEVRDAASFVVNKINSDLTHKFVPPNFLLVSNTHCAKFKMASVVSASEIVAKRIIFRTVKKSWLRGWLEPGTRQFTSNNYASGQLRDLMIVTEVQPGNALFEAHVVEDNLPDKTKSWKIVGEIQRINAYGNQSWCISGASVVKKFCFCT